MKQAGGEFDVHALCHGLIQPWPLMAEQEESLKEAWINKVWSFHVPFILMWPSLKLQSSEVCSV